MLKTIKLGGEEELKPNAKILARLVLSLVVTQTIENLLATCCQKASYLPHGV
jgi:hypothetical protein